jgi:hypothetical protein
MISNPTGLDPATKAVMTTSVIDTSATNYQNAAKGYQTETAARGGPTQVEGRIAGQQAGEESSALNNI